MPTILDIVGIQPPSSVEGESLLKAIHQGFVEPRHCYFESLYGKFEINLGITRYGIAHNDWKFIYNHQVHPETGKMRQGFELYNLSSDPEELINLAKSYPDRIDIFRNNLKEFLLNYPEVHAAQKRPDEETIEKLKSLGYLQ
jgi:arylsulfatase A-like enzyme